MAVCDLPKVETRVRFPSSAQMQQILWDQGWDAGPIPATRSKTTQNPLWNVGFVLDTETQSIFLLCLKGGL